MNLLLSNLRISVEQDGMDAYKKAASGADADSFEIVKLMSKSLDSSDQKQFFYELILVVQTPDSFANKDNLPLYTEPITKKRESKSRTERPVIIGFGPAGMFAALELVARGFKPIIFERGKKLEERSSSLKSRFDYGIVARG